jgi:cytochrome b561
MTTTKRYHSALVTLHWLLALMLIVALGMGTFVLEATPNSAPEKLDALRGHMIVGGSIGLLMLLRLVVRLVTAHPAPASTGNPMLDKLAPAMHWALYVLVFAMVGSGIAMSVMAGLPAIVFEGVGSLPTDFSNLLPRGVHGLVAKLLMAFIALHAAAALYHQFFKRDGLLARMGFGARN